MQTHLRHQDLYLQHGPLFTANTVAVAHRVIEPSRNVSHAQRITSGFRTKNCKFQRCIQQYKRNVTFHCRRHFSLISSERTNKHDDDDDGVNRSFNYLKQTRRNIDAATRKPETMVFNVWYNVINNFYRSVTMLHSNKAL